MIDRILNGLTVFTQLLNWLVATPLIFLAVPFLVWLDLREHGLRFAWGAFWGGMSDWFRYPGYLIRRGGR